MRRRGTIRSAVKYLWPAALLLLLLGRLAPIVTASEATLEWDPNPEDYVAGYRVYVGVRSREYTVSFDVGNQTSRRMQSLEPGSTYYLAVTAYAAEGLESPFSDEVSYTVPGNETNTLFVPFTMSVSRDPFSVAISFAANAGQECYVQTSLDLKSWQTACAIVAVDGINEWLDVGAAEHNQCFYRITRSQK